MNYLANPTETKAVLQLFGFDIKKKYGQNFLIDENTVRKIVLKAGVTKEDTVLEIGPGIGTMTQILCEESKKVVAVEIDSKLIPVLSETLSMFDNVTVINEDVLKCDIREISKVYNEGMALKVVANLPYYITTPIIMGLLENYADIIESVTVMIQKEVADRSRNLAFGALHFDNVGANLDFDASGHHDGHFTNSRHNCTAYQISHRSSPPTFFSLAASPSRTPEEVERMQIPRPFCTRGMSPARTKTRRPGLEMRRRPVMAALPFWYLRVILIPPSSTVTSSTYPSCLRMAARDSFIFERGTFTSLCRAKCALRIRVSMSAIGSVSI